MLFTGADTNRLENYEIIKFTVFVNSRSGGGGGGVSNLSFERSR